MLLNIEAERSRAQTGGRAESNWGNNNEHTTERGSHWQVSFGFMASKVLFSAIEFGLFTELGKESMDAAEIQKRCGFHPRGVHDFLDTLVALGC